MAGGEGGTVVAPGSPETSRLIDAVRWDDVNLRMPPKEKLSQEEIETLTRWVKMGAPDPRTEPVPPPKAARAEVFDLEARARHWAWQPLAFTSPPEVEGEDWPRDTVDRFLLSRLEESGLKPAPPATRQTLIRRVTLDLLGLPPTPAEVDAISTKDYYAFFGYLQSSSFQLADASPLEARQLARERIEKVETAHGSLVAKTYVELRQQQLERLGKYLEAAVGLTSRAQNRQKETGVEIRQEILTKVGAALAKAREAPLDPLHAMALLADAPGTRAREERSPL